jgi:hypothetical protein
VSARNGQAPFELLSATVRRRNAGLLTFTLGIALLGLVVMLAGFAHLVPYGAAGVVLWNLGAWSSFFVWGRNPLPDTRVARVVGDGRGLHLDGQLLFPRAKVKRAYLEPAPADRDDKAMVRFFGRTPFDETSVEVSAAANGRALLSAMDLDTSHALVKFRCVSPVMRNIATQLAAGLVFMALVQVLAALGQVEHLFVSALLLALVVYMPASVAVGADGVRTSWLGIGRFVPYGDIARVSGDETGVVLALRSGKERHIRTVWPSRSGGLLNWAFRPPTSALRERIEQGRIAHGFAADDAVAAAFLRPDARPVREWIQHMRALGAGASTSFRSADVPEERLWGMLENPTLDDAARAGAAVALSGTADEARRQRLRIAADATVSPKIRVALEAAADGDDDAIAAAIAPLCEDSAKRAGA